MICSQCQFEAEESAESCFNCGHSFRPQTILKRGSLVSDRYEIQSLLGRGGMGIVYKAHDRTLDETGRAQGAAQRRRRATPELARRFRSRDQAGAQGPPPQRLPHPRVRRGRAACATSRWSSSRASTCARSSAATGPLPPERGVRGVASSVAEGLQAIHEAGIIHRDLKTPNIDARRPRRRAAHGLRDRQADGRRGDAGSPPPARSWARPST